MRGVYPALRVSHTQTLEAARLVSVEEYAQRTVLRNRLLDENSEMAVQKLLQAIENTEDNAALLRQVDSLDGL